VRERQTERVRVEWPKTRTGREWARGTRWFIEFCFCVMCVCMSCACVRKRVSAWQNGLTWTESKSNWQWQRSGKLHMHTQSHGSSWKLRFLHFCKSKTLPSFFRILFLFSPLNVRPARKTHTHKRVLIAIGCEWLACVCVYVVAENIVQFFFRWLNSVSIEVVAAAWFIAARNFSAGLASHDRLSFDFAFSLTWLEI